MIKLTRVPQEASLSCLTSSSAFSQWILMETTRELTPWTLCTMLSEPYCLALFSSEKQIEEAISELQECCLVWQFGITSTFFSVWPRLSPVVLWAWSIVWKPLRNLRKHSHMRFPCLSSTILNSLATTLPCCRKWHEKIYLWQNTVLCSVQIYLSE